MEEVFVKWFDELRIGDVPLVGGKNASLGEMIRTLGSKGVNIPQVLQLQHMLINIRLKKQELI